MNKFAITDTVRVIAPRARQFDLVGTVVESEGGQFRVAFPDDYPLWFYPDELVLAEAPGVGA